MKKRSILFIAMVLGGMTFVIDSQSNQKSLNITDIQYQDSNKKPVKGPKLTRFNGQGVKPDIDFGRIPLYFITNKGQVKGKAKFYAKASRYTLWMTKRGLIFDSTRRIEENPTPGTSFLHSPKLERDVSRLMFMGANKNPELVALDKAAFKVNYFIGNDKSQWHCDIPTSMAVLYKNLYKNIDLKVYGIEKQIEYDWIVKPGGDPLDIKFRYKNVKGTRIDKEGNLLIETGFGELVHKKPVSYQDVGMEHDARRMVPGEGGKGIGAGLRACPNKRKYINVSFKKIAENTYGFEVGAYDRRSELIIDPVVLAYSTYLGGGSSDESEGIAVDAGGNVYVTGFTTSSNFPSINPYQAYQGNKDVFVTRLDLTQSGAAGLLYSTYLGGGGGDSSTGIAVDGSGNAYVTGVTDSTDFPTLNQYQTDPGDNAWDAFVTRLNASGNALSYSTYLGGRSYDYSKGIALDGSGNVYVTGSTTSSNFPSLDQYMAFQGSGDAFITKLDTTQDGASSLLYSTFLGGSSDDRGRGIAVDGSGNAYVTGFTLSTDFPIINQYQAYPGDSYWDTFVAKVDTTQSGVSALLYSTYLGGANGDYAYSIAVDNSGNAYVTGRTHSTDFPTINQYQADPGDGTFDAFVTRLDTTQGGAASFVYSTYLGGGSHDYGHAITVDGSGNAYVTGYTTSTNFPILNQYQGNQGGLDVFVTMLDTAQSGAASLLYSTYLGGGSSDYGHGIAVDGSGNVYVAGKTYSTDFPTLNQYQGDQGGLDTFVTKLFFAGPPTVDTPTSADVTYTTAAMGGNVSNTNGANVTERGVYWSTDNGFTPPGQGTKVSETGNWGTGDFTVQVTGLPASTTIYFRAFATNIAGSGYSAQASFTTPAFTFPTVTTAAVSHITPTSARGGGNVTSEGGTSVTARGVCWRTSPNPTTAHNKTNEGTGTGTFTSHITGLMENTTYYLRAYATNAVGTGYGNQVKFTTGNDFLTVTITEPLDNARVSGTVTIKATVASNSARALDASPMAVEKVEFYVDDAEIAEDSSQPYETTWDTTIYVDGSHTLKAVAYNMANQAFQDEIIVFVGNTPPEIMLNRTRLNFGSVPQSGAASDTLKAANLTTGSQTILINNSGGGILNWTVTLSQDASWLTCTPGAGTGPGIVTVSVDPSGLPLGTYNATITIEDPNAVNSPQTVPVSLEVYGSGTTTIPLGNFETPIDSSTVMSSIPVTGWALDDIEVTGIKIYRAPIVGHETGMVCIGDAVMIDGARPNKEQQYPDYPKNYQAGWGYMMLTNFLPNQGNGTFTLYAKAVDKEGNEVILGSKTIICDNAHAEKPFGAIDTPAQGGTASGSAYVNFGWALTPPPNTIPEDGSTINVWVNGVLLGKPVYNCCRQDVAALFPGYKNSNGAGGYFYLDTTAYMNGVHTISWSAKDKAGNQDGIGSRYFTIVNVNTAALSGVQTVNSINFPPGKQQMHISHSLLQQARISYEPVVVKKGYDRDALDQSLYMNTTGIITIGMKEDERLEIVLSPVPALGSTTYGYMMVGKQRLLLPVGSTLDSVNGIFYWQPGPGFFAQYRFVFVERRADGSRCKKFINVVIEPKY
jgi:hypothetical protein